MPTSSITAERYLPWPQVRPMAGNIGRATAWRMIQRGEFPAAVVVSPGRVAWRESDILLWQASRATKAA